MATAPLTLLCEKPRPLRRADDIGQFVCRSEMQTEWLRNSARQAHSSNTAQVQVITPVGSHEVVAYYAWCMHRIPKDKLHRRWQKGAGKYDQPVALLARLGTATNHERQGLGKTMLQDILKRTAAIESEIGCRGLLVHAETHRAQNFYFHTVPAFAPSPTGPLHLVLLMKDIKKAFGP